MNKNSIQAYGFVAKLLHRLVARCFLAAYVAVYHQYIPHNDTLRRMLPGSRIKR